VEARPKLAAVELIEFDPLPENGALKPEQIEKIRSLGLDILLNLTLPRTNGPILGTARYGVWEFTARGAPIHSHPYVGFWEVYRSEPVTKVSLRATTADGRKRILGETEIRTERNSLALTRTYSLESAITLLRYAAELLGRDGSPNVESLARSADATEQAVIAPSAGQVLRLAARAFVELFTTTLDSFRRRPQWSIGVAQVSALSLTKEHLANVQWLTPDWSTFLADPFVIARQGRKYIFVEEYRYRKRRAHISVIELEANGRFSEPRPVLETDFHLSFPFVFEHDGGIYMLPEQAETGQVVLYEATSFPDKWRRRAVLIDHFAGIDSVLFQYRGTWWLFTTLGEHYNGDNNLHVFHSSNLFRGFQPHPRNPVKLGVSGSRMAGKILREGEKIVRPSQNCMHRYGGSVVFQEILVLDEANYEERFLREVQQSPRSPFGISVHTINTIGETTVVDGLRIAPRWAWSAPAVRDS